MTTTQPSINRAPESNRFLRDSLSGIRTLPNSLLVQNDLPRRGKLRNLSAVDMSCLSVTERAIVILFSLRSDCAGRFRAEGAELPQIDGIPRSASGRAERSLIERGLLQYYRSQKVPGVSFFQLAGAYNFKPDMKRKLFERAQQAKALRAARSKAHALRKSSNKGLTLSEAGEQYEGNNILRERDQFLAKTGNLLPLGKEWFLSYDCPAPDNCRFTSFLHPMPETSEWQKLRFYPSVDVYAGLTPLQSCIRFYLECHADDYGRVKISRENIGKWLGRKIIKKLPKGGVETELLQMISSGHLLMSEVKGMEYDYAFIRDSAQLAKNTLKKDKRIPTIHEAEDFHHSSSLYLEYFSMLKRETIKTQKVVIHSGVEGNTLVRTHCSITVAVEEWLRAYEKQLSKARAAGIDDEQFCRLQYAGAEIDGQWFSPTADVLFWHAVKTDQPLYLVNQIYHYSKATTLQPCCQVSAKEVDGDSPSSPKLHPTIMKFLFGGSTPGEYLDDRNIKEGFTGSILDIMEQTLRVRYTTESVANNLKAC